MNAYRRDLITELKAEGATSAEAAAMADVAMSLAELQPAAKTYRLPRVGWLAVGFALATAGIAILVAVTLQSLPGTWSYPLKSTTEAAAVKLDPALTTSVMMNKSWEVAQLSAHHQSPQLVLATLNEYNGEVAALPAGDHYAAWGYCYRQLKTAAGDEQGGVRQAIEKSYEQIPQGQS